MKIESGYHESEDGETITIGMSMSKVEWQRLLFTLGMCCAAMSQGGATEISYSVLDLANTLNEGNPAWMPYPPLEHPTNPGRLDRAL